MKYHRYSAIAKGGPEVLEWQEFEPNTPQEGEIAIKGEASGVLLADVLWQLGITPIGPKPPFIPGYDLVGIVDEIGSGVSDFEQGQRVAAMIQYGGYTEYAVLPAEKVVRIPEGVDPKLAAAATTSYLTAHMLIHTEGKLKASDVLLVHGAGGGTGSALVEVAKLAGLRVYGTASTEKCELVEKKGGTPIDYKSQDFLEILKNVEPNGVDFVVDPIGGDVTTRSLKLLKPGGSLVSTGMIQSLSGGTNRFAIMLGMLRLPLWSLTHPGKKAYLWDVVSAAEKDLQQYRKDLSAIFNLLKEGKIQPEIGEEMPMVDAPKAQQMLLDYQVQGKIVLVSN
jgi:NADPH:quinone reductase-like Zn-dependent oxidoreductase